MRVECLRAGLIPSAVAVIAALALQPASAAPREITVDASKVTGTIRDLQGAAGAPHPAAADSARDIPDLTAAWRAARVSFVRTFDWHARLDTRDNPEGLFPRWSADPDDPASYNFAVADALVKTAREMGAEVMFTIASEVPRSSKPPEDLAKYERVVRRIVEHYTRGWANGMRDAVGWWEFSDQPDFLKTHYDGTPQQFLDQYAAVARAVKSVDRRLRVGGPNLAFPLNRDAPYREGLLKALRDRKLPIDFFSYIWFADNTRDPLEFVRVATEVRRVLDANGFRDTPQVLAAYNMTGIANAKPDPLEGAGFLSAAMMLLQDAPVERAAFFRLDTGWDLHYRFPDPAHTFEKDGKPDPRYHAFRLPGELLQTSRRVQVQGADDHSFIVLAGRDAARQRVRVLVTRYAIAPQYLQPLARETFEFTVPIGEVRVPVSFRMLPRRGAEAADRGESGFSLRVDNLPWGKSPFTIRRYRVDAAHSGELIGESRGEGGTARIDSDLAPPSIELVELERIR